MVLRVNKTKPTMETLLEQRIQFSRVSGILKNRSQYQVQ
jgi:hypothetical protein